MTYLDALNRILSMTPEERLQEFELYENCGMFGVESINKVVTEIRVNGNGVVKALVD
jgi:hypothetical protein